MRISEKRRKQIQDNGAIPAEQEIENLAADLGECREWIRKVIDHGVKDMAELYDLSLKGRALVEERPERLSDKVVDACERYPNSVSPDTTLALAREVKAARELHIQWKRFLAAL